MLIGGTTHALVTSMTTTTQTLRNALLNETITASFVDDDAIRIQGGHPGQTDIIGASEWTERKASLLANGWTVA